MRFAREYESVKATEVFSVAPWFRLTISSLCETHSVMSPLMFEHLVCLWIRVEIRIGEDIADPTRYIEHIVQRNDAALVVVRLASDLEVDCSDTSDGDLLLAGYGEDIGIEWGESLEPILVDGNVNVAS